MSVMLSLRMLTARHGNEIVTNYIYDSSLSRTSREMFRQQSEHNDHLTDDDMTSDEDGDDGETTSQDSDHDPHETLSWSLCPGLLHICPDEGLSQRVHCLGAIETC